MNILVLGGTGYLGNKVAHKLIEKGNSVVCTRREHSNLSGLNDMARQIVWIPASVESVETASQYMKFDYVINMVCDYGSRPGHVLYDKVLKANMEFPLNVLNKVVECGVKNFLTIGTGLPDTINMYSFSKKIFGDFGRFFSQKHNINFYDLQLEMFYGSGEPQERFLPSVIYNMLLGQDINVTLGNQHRDIIAVEDVVSAIIMIMECKKNGFYQIPVGTGIAPKISEIVDFIWEETGRKSKVNKGTIPTREGEADCIADVTFLKSIGKWNPLPWKTGIKKMINEMKYTL